jgi:2'-5' RNA ligase
VWAGLQADRVTLSALAASVAAGARRAGAPPPDEGRRYQPHLTLAYLREPADVSAFTEQLADLTATGWTATGIELVRSRLPGSAAGSRPSYETLATWPLRSRRDAAIPNSGPPATQTPATRIRRITDRDRKDG